MLPSLGLEKTPSLSIAYAPSSFSAKSTPGKSTVSTATFTSGTGITVTIITALSSPSTPPPGTPVPTPICHHHSSIKASPPSITFPSLHPNLLRHHHFVKWSLAAKSCNSVIISTRSAKLSKPPTSLLAS
ncbi:hypothetical protein OF83DRAFT_1178039 [Amylostereum chailletii]|nr:hypothetical protein OF83DRAFT_1178039 [Amylostereum chailletii]